MANKPQPNFVFKDNYGTNYKALRESAHLTQKELAEKLHIVHSTISDIEHSKNPPTIEQLQAYHDYFHVSYEYLLGETNVTQTTVQGICEYTGLTETAVEAIRLFKEQGDFLSTLFSAFQFQSVICELLKIPETSNQCLSAAMNKDHKTVKELFQRTDFLCYRAEKEFRRVIDMFDARQKETPLNYITGEPMNKQK